MRHIKVGMVVGEFFDNTLKNKAGFGGYGMLARHYVAEHLPHDEMQRETILGFNGEPSFHDVVLDGGKKVTLLPRATGGRHTRIGRLLDRCRNIWLRPKITRYLNSFDVFLGIETMLYTELLFRYIPRQKFILYLQDPRPKSEWDELDTVIETDDGSPRPDPNVRRFYRSLIREKRLVVISQGVELIDKAKDLYSLPVDIP